LFVFGHGLTYARFELTDLRVHPDAVSAGDALEVRVDVRNIGRRSARETVFLFSHDRLASVTRPQLELKAWAQLDLAAGEQGTALLRLCARELQYLGPDLTTLHEPGEVDLLVGPCADPQQLLSVTIRLT
jgi:beta-glucosidase